MDKKAISSLVDVAALVIGAAYAVITVPLGHVTPGVVGELIGAFAAAAFGAYLVLHSARIICGTIVNITVASFNKLRG